MPDLLTSSDLLIIGGGIVGAGIARDAAMRGLSTTLIDAHDFAFGTSSRSSRLLHGGMHYLAQGRISLVREASHEKMILSRIAPHLATPLPFIFPTYKGTQWKRWKLRIGVKLYDWLCGPSNLGKASALSPHDALALLPMLDPHDLTGGVRYFDGFTNDARLVLDTLRSAADHGATLLNYTALQSAERQADHWRCTLRDADNSDTHTITARIVINAAGAWAQRFPQSRVKLRLTKGIHLVIDHARLPTPNAVVMTDGPRILFAIPWGDRLILGTTDTDYTGPTDNPQCDDADVAYILNIVNTTFPRANLSRADIISAWAGLRPLIANANGKPSDISRAHEIHTQPDGWIDVAGGKLTTYRLMAEQTVTAALHLLNLPPRPCTTATTPLLPENATRFSGVLPPPITRDAVLHACTREWPRHLDDLMIRRTSWHYYHPTPALTLAPRVAPWMADALNWDDARTTHELERYQQIAQSLAPSYPDV